MVATRRSLAHFFGAILLAILCSVALARPVAASGQVVMPQDQYTWRWYTHYTTAENTGGSTTTLDSQLTNNNPDALVMVTPNWNPGGDSPLVFDWHPVGVWYNFASQHWTIFNEDEAPMPIGVAFNVAITDASNPYAFVHAATAATISGSATVISDTRTDGQPNTTILVTPNWSAGLTYDTHPLGVYYDYTTGQWVIFHEDGALMDLYASYNVFSFAPDPFNTHYLHTATPATIVGNYTLLDNPYLNGHPYSQVYVTQDRKAPYCTPRARCVPGGPVNNSLVAVLYDTSTQRWAIFNETGATIPVGARFHVFIVGS